MLLRSAFVGVMIGVDCLHVLHVSTVDAPYGYHPDRFKAGYQHLFGGTLTPGRKVGGQKA